ncbi:MAG: hypothetical protein AAGF90_16565 [Pseudomonadota bacterium]
MPRPTTQSAAIMTAFAAAIFAAPPAAGGPADFLALGAEAEAPTEIRFEGQRGFRGAFGPSLGQERYDEYRRPRQSGAFFSRGSRDEKDRGILSIFGIGVESERERARRLFQSKDRTGR